MSARLRRPEALLLVAVGGVVGANLRYLVEILVPGTLLATALVNVVGSFALGVLLTATEVDGRPSAAGRRLLGTGLLSSFTTYSTFVVDALAAAPAVGVGYVLGSYGLGFVGVAAARALIEWRRR